ncbi:hypothetical protein [Flavobacterium sp.]|uniref:hypothetical protein n=1 Tax=Flavobacterium sp. TaxID=239 RepID=UPI003528BCB5
MIKDRTCDKTFLTTWGIKSKHQDISRIHSRHHVLGSHDPVEAWYNPSVDRDLSPSEYILVLPSSKSLNISPNLIINLPISLDYLSEEIIRSKYILELEPNWDDNNSEAYTSETLKVAIDFIIKFALFIKKTYNKNMIKPRIYHGPNGSIDLSWSENNFRLFINIEKNGAKAHYYSDYNKKQVSEGIFDILSDFHFSMIPHPIIF